MLKRLMLVMVTLIIIVGCSSESPETDAAANIGFDENHTRISFVELNDQAENLLSIEYRINNKSAEEVAPFYVNYVVHGEVLADSLGYKEYSSYKALGGEGITLTAGEVYQGGDNMQVSFDQSEFINMQNESRNIIELQLVDIASENVWSSLQLSAEWIQMNYTEDELKSLQEQVDGGHRPGALEWQQVAREFVSANHFELDEGIEVDLIKDEKSLIVAQYALKDGRLVELELLQPAKEGATGIYVVNRYRLIVGKD